MHANKSYANRELYREVCMHTKLIQISEMYYVLDIEILHGYSAIDINLVNIDAWARIISSGRKLESKDHIKLRVKLCRVNFSFNSAYI